MMNLNRSSKGRIKNAGDFMAFTLPALILISITSLLPFIMNFIYSFTNWDGIQKTVEFVGFKNFISVIKD